MNSHDSRRTFLRNAALLGVGASAVPALAAVGAGAAAPVRPGEVTLDRTALEDILAGCAVLGCGGGGTYAEGLARLSTGLEAGSPFRLLPVAELGDDEWVASPYGIGSLAPQSEEDQARFAALPRAKEASRCSMSTAWGVQPPRLPRTPWWWRVCRRFRWLRSAPSGIR